MYMEWVYDACEGGQFGSNGSILFWDVRPQGGVYIVLLAKRNGYVSAGSGFADCPAAKLKKQERTQFCSV